MGSGVPGTMLASTPQLVMLIPRGLCALVCFLFVSGHAHAQTHFLGANSRLDYSGIQGQGGWQYGYWDNTTDPTYEVTDFRQLSVWTGQAWRYSTSTPPWTVIDAVGCHPDDGSINPRILPIRRWVSPVRALLRLSGVIAKIPVLGDGVVGRVIVDGIDRDGAIIPASDTTGHKFDILIHANVGTVVDLMVDPRSNDVQDYTRFECVITPEIPLVTSSTADFSGSQGLAGWKYGYYDGDSASPFTPQDFEEMPTYQAGSWTVSVPTYWTVLTPSGGHPNGQITSGGRSPVQQWAVRRWECTVDGVVDVRGSLSKSNLIGGNGVVGHIFVDGVEAWRAAISGTDGYGVGFNMQLAVTRSSVIDFALDPGASNDLSDSSTFVIEIASRDRYGTGTPGCDGASTLYSSQTPRVGSLSYKVLATRGPTNGLGLILMSDGQDISGSSLPGIGVKMHVTLNGLVVPLVITSDMWGEGSQALPIPSNSALAGVQLFAQGFWVWSTSPPACSPLPTPYGISSTNGLSILVQMP